MSDVSAPGMECGNCGSLELSRSEEQQKFVYGTGSDAVELTATVRVFTCGNCGESFTTGDAEEARHDAVCRHLGVLTPDEIRQLRTQRGWSQTELARHMRCGEASVKRWESGALIQNGANDLLLRVLSNDRGFRLVAELEAVRSASGCHQG